MNWVSSLNYNYEKNSIRRHGQFSSRFCTGIARLSQEELTMCRGRYDFRGEKFPDWKSVMEYLI